MNTSCDRDASQVLGEFAGVVTCSSTHFEPFKNSVKLMHYGFFPSLRLTSPDAIMTFMFSSLYFSSHIS